MKVAVTSTGDSLDAQMDPRFGRAQYLLIVDTDSLEFEAVENPNIAAGAGAGIQTSQMIANKGAQAVLTGNCGPNAYQTLAAAGLQVYVGLSGTVREAVEAFKRGEVQAVGGPSVPGHFGVGMGGGMGMGRGMGRGMGGGRGMGMGRGTGAGFSGPIPGPTPPASREEELAQLKEGAEALKQQLDQISQRIQELEQE
jgi:predicted Fe-Mo cluster-binding NifX family protein